MGLERPKLKADQSPPFLLTLRLNGPIPGPGELSRYSDSLRAGRFGDRIPVGGRDFPHPSRTTLGPTHPHIQCVPGPSPGVKRPGRGVYHPPHLAPRLKKRVELYLYSPGPSWPVIGRNLTLPLLMDLYHVSCYDIVSCTSTALLSYPSWRTLEYFSAWKKCGSVWNPKRYRG
jgi:hypothetical protein